MSTDRPVNTVSRRRIISDRLYQLCRYGNSPAVWARRAGRYILHITVSVYAMLSVLRVTATSRASAASIGRVIRPADSMALSLSVRLSVIALVLLHDRRRTPTVANVDAGSTRPRCYRGRPPPTPRSRPRPPVSRPAPCLA